MKKNLLFSVLSIVFLVMAVQLPALAQDTLVQWTFPTDAPQADAAAIPANLDQEIETAEGTSDIQFKNGATTRAAQATGWDSGNDSKKWKVEFETTGYGNLKLYSKISSGGQNPGPRDFKVQYKAGDGSWTDIDGSGFMVSNDWTTGVVEALVIPQEADNQALAKIRWIMTSDTATDGNLVTETGIAKIDDIYIIGEIIDSEKETLMEPVISLYPNPASDFITLQGEGLYTVELFDMQGKQLLQEQVRNQGMIDVSGLLPATYFVRIHTAEQAQIITKKLMIK